jgi:hypothetical protein
VHALLGVQEVPSANASGPASNPFYRNTDLRPCTAKIGDRAKNVNKIGLPVLTVNEFLV